MLLEDNTFWPSDQLVGDVIARRLYESNCVRWKPDQLSRGMRMVGRRAFSGEQQSSTLTGADT